MKSRIFIIISLVAAIAYAGKSTATIDSFSPAKDLPRGALVYAQFSDLPALIRRWDESQLKAKYLNSQNFLDLTNRHLGLKLASRWQEFSDASGFPLELGTVAAFADGPASIAIYDIGKLDLVFIAPVSDELFAATQLMQNSSRFEQEDLSNEITVYHVAVEADRGRQKQQILFTHLKGRLIVATSEKLLAGTIANISGRSSKDRLSDEPGFRQLSQRVTPHLATVWVDQAALNDDYYFKRYWLMNDPAKLKNVRAGMFDLSINDENVNESREFLLSKPELPSAVSVADGRELLSHVPGDASLFRISAASGENVNDAIKIILEVPDRAATASGRTTHHSYFRDDSDYYLYESRFRDLGSEFDQNINDNPDDVDEIKNEKIALDISPILAAARPAALVSIFQPMMMPKPLFAEFNYAAVVRLRSPGSFDRQAFESAIEKCLVERVMIPQAAKAPSWTTQNTNGIAFREFAFPMLDRKFSYSVTGNELFMANNSEFLRKVCETKISTPAKKLDQAFIDWQMIDLKQSKEQFALLFSHLEDGNAPGDFFTGNIGSLIAAVPEGTRVEIKRSASNLFTHEDVTMHLK